MKCCWCFASPVVWRSALVLAWLAIVCGFGFAESMAADVSSDQLLNEAQVAQRQGKFGEALILATTAINSARTKAQGDYVRGPLYADDRQQAQAIQDFTPALN